MARTTTRRGNDTGSRQTVPESRSRAVTRLYPTKNDLSTK